MIKKCNTVNADALILDLEDSVPSHEKNNARDLLRKALPSLDRGRKEVGVRINNIGSSYWLDDLIEVFGGATVEDDAVPDFVMLPKVRFSSDIKCLDKCLEYYEKKRGLKRTLRIIATIEDPLGFSNLVDIAACGGRLWGLVFGRADYAAEMNCDDSALAFPRSTIPIVAMAYHLMPIDSSYLKVKDESGMRNDALNGKKLGYKGKTAIHPVQIDVINKVYSHSKENSEWASNVLSAYEKAARQGIGATVYSGEMIDQAKVLRAKKILTAGLTVFSKNSEYFPPTFWNKQLETQTRELSRHATTTPLISSYLNKRR